MQLNFQFISELLRSSGCLYMLNVHIIVQTLVMLSMHSGHRSRDRMVVVDL